MSVGWARNTSRAAWHIAVISAFFRHNDLLTLPVYPTSRSRCIMSSTSNFDLSLAPKDSLWGTLLAESGVNGVEDVIIVWVAGISRGAGGGFGEAAGAILDVGVE